MGSEMCIRDSPFFPFSRFREQTPAIDAITRNKFTPGVDEVQTWQDVCGSEKLAVSAFEAWNARVKALIPPSQVILPTAPGVSNEGPRSRVLGLLPAVSWPWVPAWGSLEPPRRGGENAQKTRKNGGKMGEIRSKTCEHRQDPRRTRRGAQSRLGTGV